MAGAGSLTASYADKKHTNKQSSKVLLSSAIVVMSHDTNFRYISKHKSDKNILLKSCDHPKQNQSKVVKSDKKPIPTIYHKNM